MTTQEIKHYLILFDESGVYQDAASFPSIAGIKTKIKSWQRDRKLIGKNGDYVMQFKFAKKVDL